MNDQKYSTQAIINLILQLTLLAVLLTWCFLILQSFISPIIWAMVMTITLFPLHKHLMKYLRVLSLGYKLFERWSKQGETQMDAEK